MEIMEYGNYHTDDVDRHPQIDLMNLQHQQFRQPTYNPYAQLQSQQDFYSHHQTNTHHAYAHHLASLAVDVKPRLTKEQHDVLEGEYQKLTKPNTQTKKGFAEMLGVSLDKVNNWFQNRRAKSKQDAKKLVGPRAAQDGQSQQLPHQSLDYQAASSPSRSSSLPPQLSLSETDINSDFFSSSSDYLNPSQGDTSNDIAAVNISSGLGITQVDMHSHQQSSDTPTTMSPQDLMHDPSALQTASTSLKVEGNDDFDVNRRTLTQDDFDAFGSHGDYATSKSDSAMNESPKQVRSTDLFSSEFFSEMGAFNFNTSLNGSSTMNDAPPEFTSNNVFGSPDLFGDVINNDPLPRTLSKQDSISDWSDVSTPSLSLNPLVPANPSGLLDQDISPRGKANSTAPGQWQPGTSVPVDYDEMDREFREAAQRSARLIRGNTCSTSSLHSAYTDSQPFSQAEAPASLTLSLGNMGLSGEEMPRTTSRQTSISGAAGTIAARRQRPKPQPLSTSSLRSASYCGPLPTAPGLSNNGVPAPAPPTLRRIKSSNVMNGIASGRIQKSVVGAQRSPLNFSFADAASAPKFARRVASYSPANGGMPMSNSSLAPPTPLSPTELAQRLELRRKPSSQLLRARTLSRQPSIQEMHEEPHHMMNLDNVAASFASPPITPNYAAHFARGRLGSTMENTPPQSAPASQQCFSGNMYSQAPQMQATLSQGQMMQAHQQMYMPTMSNEYPLMQNMITPIQPMQQQMQPGQYLQMLQNQQQQMNNMSGLLSDSQTTNINYNNMQYPHGLSTQQITPPNMNYGFVPSSPASTFMSQQQNNLYGGAKPAPTADFFVHEYSPPQDVKGIATPRKAGELGPKNYTFANHGPEHFSKTKTKDMSASPGSSSGHSSAA